MENMVTQLILENTFKNKKVLVTGHTGFKGSWLCKILLMLGAEIKGIALEPTSPYGIFQSCMLEKHLHNTIVDIRNFENLSQEIESFQPDFVFHLAAQPLVRDSYNRPVYTYETNVIGTLHVLESIKKLEKKVDCVFITTDKVYLNKEWEIPYKETDRLGGHDPYSSSKACMELLIDSYRNSFFHLDKYAQHQKSIAVARAGNVIGGGDFSQDRLIPDIIKHYEEKKTLEIRFPNAVRPWQHVLEPLFGYLTLAQKLVQDPIKFSTAYNFGPYPKDNYSVLQILNYVKEHIFKEFNFEISNSQNSHLHEAGLLTLDINKVIEELEWKPQFNFEQTLEYTFDWYKHFLSKSISMNDFTEKQIRRFL